MAKRKAYFLLTPLLSFFLANAQLSSIEVSGSSAVINNLYYRLNGTRDVLFRFNQKIGWYFSGNIAIGYNVTRFNTLPRVHNDYTDLKNIYLAYQVGGNFNLLTAIRTYKKGGKTAIGDRSISLAHFKIYLCAGAEYLQLKHTEDKQSFDKTIHLYEGMGIEVYRLGKLSKQKYGALVPFFEGHYFHNISGGYYSSKDGFVNFQKIAISLGFKLTFGLPEN